MTTVSKVGHPTQRPRDLEATAYHEAGHAVVAFHLHCYGRRTRRVTIVPEGDALGRHDRLGAGRLIRNGEGGTLSLRRVQDEVMVSLAGPSAERRATGRRSQAGARSDNQAAGEWALAYCGSGAEVSAFLRWLEIRTRELVASKWSEVEAVAKALLEQRTLDRDGVRDAIESTYPPRVREAARELRAHWQELRDRARAERRQRARTARAREPVELQRKRAKARKGSLRGRRV